MSDKKYYKHTLGPLLFVVQEKTNKKESQITGSLFIPSETITITDSHRNIEFMFNVMSSILISQGLRKKHVFDSKLLLSELYNPYVSDTLVFVEITKEEYNTAIEEFFLQAL